MLVLGTISFSCAKADNEKKSLYVGEGIVAFDSRQVR